MLVVIFIIERKKKNILKDREEEQGNNNNEEKDTSDGMEGWLLWKWIWEEKERESFPNTGGRTSSGIRIKEWKFI